MKAGSETKRDNLLTIAADRFLSAGFTAVSVDELVRSANQSKTNVYTWFGGKEGLFLATVDRLVSDILVPLRHSDFTVFPLRDGMIRLGDTMMTAIFGDRALALRRLVIAEAPNFPELASAWFQAGPERAYAVCASFIGTHMAAGRLRTGDTRRAAIFFHDMLVGDLENRLLLSLRPPPDRAERMTLARSAVDLFLQGYGVVDRSRMTARGARCKAAIEIPQMDRRNSDE